MNHADIIIAAHRASVEAAKAAAHLPPVVVDPAYVESMIDKLASRAAFERSRDPEAHDFHFTAWNAHDRSEAANGNALIDKLRDLNFTPIVETVTVRSKQVPQAIRITYEDLAAVAEVEQERRATWIADALPIWTKAAGPTAKVDMIEPKDGDAFLNFSTHAPAVTSDRDQYPVHDRIVQAQTDTRWSMRSPAEVVAEMVAKLCPIVWSFEDLEKQWKERGGSALTASRTKWIKDDAFPGPTLIFSTADSQVTYLVREVAQVSAEQIVSKAADELKLPAQKASGNGGGRGGKHQGQQGQKQEQTR